MSRPVTHLASRLPLNLFSAFSAFAKPVRVRDTGGGAYLGGRWTEEPETERTIMAVVLQLSLQEVELLGRGAASGGGIVLHTTSFLYAADLLGDGTGSASPDGGRQTRQSYAMYMGYVFKVVAGGFVKGNATYNTYKAVRYDAR